MNIPWKVSEKQSQQVGLTVVQLPTSYTVFGPVDVRGYDWIEFSVKVTNNVGVDPASLADALIDYGEDAGDLSGDWFPITTEDVDVSGVAPQSDYNPRRSISGATAVWRIPVAVHGQVMRLRLQFNGTPDPTSEVSVYAYRRSF